MFISMKYEKEANVEWKLFIFGEKNKHIHSMNGRIHMNQCIKSIAIPNSNIFISMYIQTFQASTMKSDKCLIPKWESRKITRLENGNVFEKKIFCINVKNTFFFYSA